jgi:membrane protein YdbS with pleckstrin-like domain
MVAPRSVGNAVIKLVLLSVLLFPLSALLPLTIPLTVLRVRRWRYRLEATRIVISWGIVYRREASILLDRVDSLQQSQGPINKVVKNGNVSIMTAGSSKADLLLIDCPDYLHLYQVIRDHSQKS